MGGPLVKALEELDIDELTHEPNWQGGLLIAVIDLPTSMQIDGVLKAWLPKAARNIRFADYVLFKIAKYLPKRSDTRRTWIDNCLVMAVANKNFSLVESLILVLGQDAKNHPQLLEIATDYAKTSPQMRRVLWNACNINIPVT